MRRRKIFVSIAYVIVILVISALFGAVLEPSNDVNLLLAIISAVVALLALYISLCTYISIDEVNAISRMDGNVMENQKYLPNILRLTFKYPQETAQETAEAVLSLWESMFDKNKIQTGAHLADNVQEVADILVLVPFFINTSDKDMSSKFSSRISDILTRMKNSTSRFKEFSDGSCKLLEETVNLIDSVFAYQKMTVVAGANSTKFLEVRGAMFVNPVSIVLYNNYLGLYFLRRATSAIGGLNTNVSMLDEKKRIFACDDDVRALALLYVDKALHCFSIAKCAAGDDVVWNAFICFNSARCEYLGGILDSSFGKKSKRDWEGYMNESIRSWVAANRMLGEYISSMPGINRSWLQTSMISQENKVMLVKIIYQILEQKTLTDHNGNKWLEEYSEVLQTDFYKKIPVCDPLDRTDKLVANLNALLAMKG